MVSRPILGLLCALGCTSHAETEPHALVLRGFHLVDVSAGRLREETIVVEHGVVVARQTLPRAEVIEGQGAFLMPMLWDLKASLWGNDSARHYDELMQEMSFTQCLRVQLYYGVGHVGVFGMDPQWARRELHRAKVFGLAAAEALYPDKVLCSTANFACEAATDVPRIEALLGDKVEHDAPFVYVAYGDPKETPDVPGVSEAVLKDILSRASARHLPTFVVVTDWQRAATAVDLGARVVYGLPEGPIPEDLLTSLRDHGAAWAPALSRYLELDRLLGDAAALDDPFLAVTLRADVRNTYRSEQGLWQGWRAELTTGRARGRVALESVRRAVEASVTLIAVSDAGWTAGTFQGYASLSLQARLEGAGLSGWQRLATATTASAELFARRASFEPGQAANFVLLDGDPSRSAANLRKIRGLVREGKLVDRAALLPDLTRGNYEP